MDILGIIPARGGSVGIPNKNLVPLAGKPLLQYTVEAASSSKKLKDFILTSDDPEIIKFYQSLGRPCDYVRPDEFATNTSSMASVVRHLLDWYKDRHGRHPEYFVILQPTSPLRTAEDIDLAIDLILKEDHHSLVSVHQVKEHPFECLQRKGQDSWKFVATPQGTVTRRQDYASRFYFVNGCIYIRRTREFLEDGKFILEGNSVLFEMPRSRGSDIDDPIDLYVAESLIRFNQENAV